MKYKVLHFEQAPWKVGETETDRDARVRRSELVALADCYPGSYPGKVVSVIPASRQYSPADLADPSRKAVTLELTKDERAALASRVKRISVGKIQAVTFDEHHGRTAQALKERFPLDYRVREKEEQAALDATMERNRQAQIQYEEDVAEWAAGEVEVLGLGLIPQVPRPTPPEMEQLPELEFADLAAKLMRLLPKTEVCSGAGLYKTDASGTTHNDIIASFDDNLLLYSEDLASWSAYNGGTVEANAEDAPNGQVTADTVTDDSAVALEGVFQEITVADDSLRRLCSVHVKKGTGTVALVMNYRDGAPTIVGDVKIDLATGAVSVDTVAPDDYGAQAESVGGYWRFWLVLDNNSSGNVTLRVRLHPTSVASAAYTGSATFWGAQLEQASAPSAYKPTRASGDTQVTLTTGGLTDADRDGEVFASGGNSYAVVRNGTDSVLVVGDATGESGACTVSPYTTIQSALDQLWTDQGSAAFTASQYIRVFADTYDENIVTNVGLDPDEANGYLLILEGDPTDDRANMSIASTSGLTIFTQCDQLLVRHLSLSSVGNYVIRAQGIRFALRDCAVTSNSNAVWCQYPLSEVSDCTITVTANKWALLIAGGVVEKTVFIGVGKATSTLYGIASAKVRMSACVISGFQTALALTPLYATSKLLSEIHQCTFYDCERGFSVSSASPVSFHASNCVFEDVDYPVYLLNAGKWPEESSTRFGDSYLLRNNCFHNYTAFAYDGTDTKTYAQFAALNQVDASGDLDATDPLLTDPGSGDFSLQTGSPCKRAGVGAGVINDVDGDPFDGFHPDIGAKTTGVGPWRKPEEVLEVVG